MTYPEDGLAHLVRAEAGQRRSVERAVLCGRRALAAFSQALWASSPAIYEGKAMAFECHFGGSAPRAR